MKLTEMNDLLEKKLRMKLIEKNEMNEHRKRIDLRRKIHQKILIERNHKNVPGDQKVMKYLPGMTEMNERTGQGPQIEKSGEYRSDRTAWSSCSS